MSALQDLAISIACDENAPHNIANSAWSAHVSLHYTLFRCLWEGRTGNDAAVKVLLKKLYLLMDESSDRGVFGELRSKGGVMEVKRPSSYRSND